MALQKIVLYTQRVEIVESYGERRDCADQNIPIFIQKCGYLPVPVPNILNLAKEMVLNLKPAGIFLTGGNSLEKYGGDAPERDAVEKGILELALERDIPMYGFCRGMQVIEDFFGARLQNVGNHVAIRHKIHGKLGEYMVNSYHNQACYQVPNALEVLAVSEDGVIEAVCAKEKWVMGTMWHPERETPFCQEDINRVKKLFKKEVKGYESDYFSSRTGNEAAPLNRQLS